jgi:hypothetical protein
VDERFPLDPKRFPEVWRIGRRGARGPEHCFDLRRREDGGISISHIETSLSDSERQRLLAHFGRARTRIGGGRTEEGLDVTVAIPEEAGSFNHFVSAVYALPAPFTYMGSAK